MEKVEVKSIEEMSREELRGVILDLCRKHNIPPILPSGEAFKIIESYDRRHGKVVHTIYATRTLAAYLASTRGLVMEIDRSIVEKMLIPEEVTAHCVIVGARVKDPETGRVWEDVGCAPLPPIPKGGDSRELGLYATQLANAVKTALTQAWRRAVLNLVGLGGLDESELPGLTANAVSEETAPEAPAETVEPVKRSTVLEAAYRTIRAAAEANPDEFQRALDEFGVKEFWDLDPKDSSQFIRYFIALVREKRGGA